MAVRLIVLPGEAGTGLESESIDELRARFPAGISDEEFLLRVTMPAGQVDAMLAAGPAARHYDPSTKPVLSLIRKLAARDDLRSVRIEKAGFKLELHRSGAAGAARRT